MGNIIPRKKSIPVQAHRVEDSASLQPGTVRVPAAAGGTAPHSVTQNFIYVAAPSAPSQPPPPPSPMPHELHFHNTNVFEAPRRRRRERGTSFFGTLALFLGGLGCVAASVAPLMQFAKPLAEAGGAIAGVGFITATLFRRAGRGIPLLGFIVSGIAFGLWARNSGQLYTLYEKLRAQSPVALPSVDFSTRKAPPTAVPSTPVPMTVPKSVAPAHLQDHSIFGDGTGWMHPADEPAATVQEPANVDREPAHFSAPAAPVVDLKTATADLDTARSFAAKRLGIDYPSAKATADQADFDYQQAKTTYTLGSAALLAVSQKRLEANSQLNQINAQLRSDPAVAARRTNASGSEGK